MAPHTEKGIVPEAASDSWYNVTDPKERKRIQDRLAQRARRRRLADGKTTKITSSRTSTTVISSQVESSSSSTQHSPPLHPFGVSQSVLSALFQNGKILGLKCGVSFPSKSRIHGHDVPSTLHPTLLQMSTVHLQWIDYYPMQDCRDELILNSGNFEEEEFLHDLFSIPSFTIEPGCASWDPTGWAIEPGFERKWGWLFPSVNKSSTSLDFIEL